MGGALELLAKIESRGKKICLRCEKELNGTYCFHCQDDTVSVDRPEMVICPGCKTKQAIDEHTKTYKGKRLVCSHCGKVISINDYTGEVTISIIPF